MAGSKPFKLGGAGKPAKVADRPRYNQAETNKKAVGDKTLVEAGQEEMQPDMELDSTAAEEGELDGERPCHKVANPWPAAKPVSHKPFKL